MKNALRSLLGRPPDTRTGSPATASTTAATDKPEADAAQWPITQTKTGETIYGDRPLRFQALTLPPAEIEALEQSTNFHGGFKIRVARRSPGQKRAGTLVEKRYMSRGYATPTAPIDPNLFIFIAYDEGVLVGTVGVRLDSSDGLSADALYKTEIDGLRKSGCRLCEFTRLAVDKTVASKPVLAGLFHTAYLYAAVLRGCTHAVIEVNPRHVVFYRRALGFVPIGPERINQRVNAPAVLLAVPFAEIAEGLRKYAGSHEHVGTRSLFPYGFQSHEERGVLARLKELVESA